MTRNETLRSLIAAGLLGVTFALPAHAQEVAPVTSETKHYMPVPPPPADNPAASDAAYAAPASTPTSQAAPAAAAPMPVPTSVANQKQMHYLPSNPYANRAPAAQAQPPEYQARQPMPPRQDPRQTPNQALSGEAALPSPKVAEEASSGMHAVQQGNVRYITGGIGDEERDALNSVKGEYNVHVTSTNRDGEFNGDTQITIVDRSGAKLVNVDAGPLFYAQLPAGSYTLQAVNNGIEKQQKVTVGGSKDAKVYFRW